MSEANLNALKRNKDNALHIDITSSAHGKIIKWLIITILDMGYWPILFRDNGIFAILNLGIWDPRNFGKWDIKNYFGILKILIFQYVI